MGKKKSNLPPIEFGTEEDLEKALLTLEDRLGLILQANQRLEYLEQFQDIELLRQSPNIPLAEIEEFDFNSPEPLAVNRFNPLDNHPNACYSRLLCNDITNKTGMSIASLIAQIRLYRVKGIPSGIIAVFQRVFANRTDMINPTQYAPIEIYQRVVEDYYSEREISIKRGSNSFLYYEKGHQGAIVGWFVELKVSHDKLAQFILEEQTGFIAEIEKRYASRMAYTDVSELNESNPWLVIMENLKSIDKKVEDALSKKNMTTIYGDVKISKGDFVGGDKVTSVQNNISIFTDIYAQVDEKENLSKTEKVKLKSEISELGNAVQNIQPDEGFIKKRLQTIKKMAPDIFEITVNTILNPISGLGTVVKKIAEKMKEVNVK